MATTQDWSTHNFALLQWSSHLKMKLVKFSESFVWNLVLQMCIIKKFNYKLFQISLNFKHGLFSVVFQDEYFELEAHRFIFKSTIFSCEL